MIRLNQIGQIRVLIWLSLKHLLPTEIENQFLNVEIEPENIAEKSEELEKTIADLEQKEERWLELSMKLEG